MSKRPGSELSSNSKKAKRLCVFRKDFSEEWPCIVRVSSNAALARCVICNTDFSIAHGGRQDCERHVKSQKHIRSSTAAKSAGSVSSFFTSTGSSGNGNVIDDAVIRAEALFCGFLVEHNISIAASDHAGRLFRAMFIQPGVSAADIIKKYGCARTKTTAIIKEMANHESFGLIESMKAGPYSIATDASNDKKEKLFPLVIRIQKDGEVRNELFSVVECEGRATGENIANMILKELLAKGVPFSNCIALTTDNANVMIGKKNGVYGKLLEQNNNLFSTGCICHRLHLAAECAHRQLPVNVNDFFLDVYYYMEKSSLRVKSFQDFQEISGTPAHDLCKHCPTRWLSLGKTCKWTIEQWEPLVQFFSAECDDGKEGGSSTGSSRKENVLKNLKSRTMKVSILYLDYVLPIFDSANLLFQQEAPLLHKQRRLMMKTIRDLLTMFVKPCALRGKLVTEVDFSSPHNIVSHRDVMVGSAVRQYMDTNFSEQKKKEFIDAVINFLKSASTYLLSNLPLNEPLLRHAEVADISNRDSANFRSLKFFMDRYPILLKTDINTIEKEFREYLICDLPTGDFSKLPMDQQWSQLGQIKDDCGAPLFTQLPGIMINIISIPHSNASCERIFSLVRANRTDFRANMSVETLQALLILKQNTGPCFQRNPSAALLKACKSATTLALANSGKQV